jgi:hypothetical protein
LIVISPLYLKLVNGEEQMKFRIIALAILLSITAIGQAEEPARYSDKYGRTTGHSSKVAPDKIKFTDPYGKTKGYAQISGDKIVYSDKYGRVTGQRTFRVHVSRDRITVVKPEWE